MPIGSNERCRLQEALPGSNGCKVGRCRASSLGRLSQVSDQIVLQMIQVVALERIRRASAQPFDLSQLLTSSAQRSVNRIKIGDMLAKSGTSCLNKLLHRPNHVGALSV